MELLNVKLAVRIAEEKCKVIKIFCDWLITIYDACVPGLFISNKWHTHTHTHTHKQRVPTSPNTSRVSITMTNQLMTFMDNNNSCSMSQHHNTFKYTVGAKCGFLSVLTWQYLQASYPVLWSINTSHWYFPSPCIMQFFTNGSGFRNNVS